MGLSNKLSCEAGSFSCHLNLATSRFFQLEVLSPYFPALEPWVAWSVSLPICSSRFIHTQMWDFPLCQPPPIPPGPALSCVLSTRLPISAPPTSLYECFFFNSLVVGLPHSSIFCQFWGYFVFKLLFSFFWLYEEAQCIYLCLHLGQINTVSDLIVLFLSHLTFTAIF